MKYYMFLKSGNIVTKIKADTVVLNGKTIRGYTVRRLDGKVFFAPAIALAPYKME